MCDPIQVIRPLGIKTYEANKFKVNVARLKLDSIFCVKIMSNKGNKYN